MVKDTNTKKPEEKKPKAEMVRHDDGTVELNLSVSAADVKKAREKVINELIKRVNIPGFRKGMAPKKIAEQKLSQEAVNEELLKELVTDTYKTAAEKHGLKPIITPQIHIEAFNPDKDLHFTAEVAEEPKIELGDYKKAIKDLTAKSKIITKKGEEPQKPSLDAIIEAGMSQAKITISRILIDREVSRLLSQLMDDVKMLGMTLEQYMESKKITGEQLREEYAKRAERDIKLEFFLRKVADEEKINVTAEDITNTIGKIEDKAQQDEMSQNPYLVASIIRQQKTIDFLSAV